MRICIFCGERASTKEDAWPPRWLTKRFPASDMPHVEAERGGVSLGTWRAASAAIRVGCVCAGCNNGWMSRLEESARLVVEPLFEQRQQRIEGGSLPMLAAWAVKGAMVLENLNPGRPRFYRESERTQLRLTQAIPSRTSVWLAWCVEQQASYGAAKYLSDRGGSAEVQGFATTVAFGPVAIQVMTIRAPASVPAKTNVTIELRAGPWDETLVPVWPIHQDRLSWPPRKGLLGDIGLEALTDRFSPAAEEAA